MTHNQTARGVPTAPGLEGSLAMVDTTTTRPVRPARTGTTAPLPDVQPPARWTTRHRDAVCWTVTAVCLIASAAIAAFMLTANPPPPAPPGSTPSLTPAPSEVLPAFTRPARPTVRPTVRPSARPTARPTRPGSPTPTVSTIRTPDARQAPAQPAPPAREPEPTRTTEPTQSAPEADPPETTVIRPPDDGTEPGTGPGAGSGAPGPGGGD